MSMFMQMLKGWSRMSEPGVVVSLCVYRRDLDHLWMFMVSVFLVFYPFSPSSTAALSGGGGRDRVNSSERERGDREETERRRTDRNHDVTTAVVWRWAGSVQCKEVCVCVCVKHIQRERVGQTDSNVRSYRGLSSAWPLQRQMFGC